LCVVARFLIIVPAKEKQKVKGVNLWQKLFTELSHLFYYISSVNISQIGEAVSIQEFCNLGMYKYSNYGNWHLTRPTI
jgi:cytochrome b561